jgi:hypothetical protein
MEAISLDLRQRIADALDAGEQTRAEIARRFAVTERWIYQFLELPRETGDIKPRPHGGGRQTAITEKQSYGRAVRGCRVYGHVPNRHREAFTMLSAINIDGRIPTMVFNGTTDITAMLSYLDWLLIPELKEDDIVVMDNFGMPQVSRSCRFDSIRRSARVVLAPVLARLGSNRAYLVENKSSAGGGRRTDREPTGQGIGRALKTISEQDIANCIRHCGYKLNTPS